MNRTLKRIILTLLAVSVCVLPLTGTLAAPERLQAGQEESMETALRAAKSIISIDDEVYTDFNYSSSYTNYETREGLVWYFNWDGGETGHISASVTDDGTLLGYSKYVYGKETFGFADISKDAAIKAASEFLKKANPETHNYYPAPAEASAGIHSGHFSVIYYADIKGYPFNSAAITIQVDKFTGEVTSYYTSNFNPAHYKSDADNPVIAPDTALKAYAEKIGLTLEYFQYFDYKEKTMTIFPAYRFNSGADRYISAVTGEVVNYVYDRAGNKEYMNDSVTASESAMDAGGASGLSPAEIAAIEKVSSFISGEKALENLLTLAGLDNLDTDSMSDYSINLTNNYYEPERFQYNIYMSNYSGEMRTGDIVRISGRVDASSGRVLSFNVGYYDDKTVSDRKAVMTAEQAQATAVKFAETNAPAEYAKTVMEEPAEFDLYPIEYGYRNYDFNFTRYENNTPFRANGISVTIDPVLGKITGYDLNWYTSVSFPSVSSVLTAEGALTAFTRQNPAELKHITTGSGALSLVYDFVKPGHINPHTGNAMNYDGTEVAGGTEEPDYSDVKGHWSEPYVTKLLENGVYLWGGSFMPNKQMTQQEFLNYITQTNQNYGVYPMTSFTDVRPVQPENIKIDADKPATRQEAARIIAEYLGYSKLASESKWFAYPFTDAADDAYKGYITVCTALGIFEQGNKFNATNIVTNAEAAKMLNNLIKNATSN